MNLDKFTVMSQEAIQRAHAKAEEMRHQSVLPEHLLWVFPLPGAHRRGED
ncbi:MAG: hypothetical protein WBB73_02065 [Candidatus Aminicenantaceae bacterium]